MKVFVIHRFKDRKLAKRKLKSFSKQNTLDIQPIFLNSSGSEKWKDEALNAIQKSEVIVVFNRKDCEESENARWEIEKAQTSGKEIINLNSEVTDELFTEKLKSLYDLKKDFDSCFSTSKENYLELYKLMLSSSENLIQRRQKTSAFFITVIGSLLAIAGFLVKTGAINNKSYGILYGFSVVGLLLCNSWRNLIDNYGKLNKAKFDVILRLEKELGAQVYTAEWIALGKGIRPQKYKSFTSTEKNVPLYFGILILVLTLISIIWQIWG
jgi:arsenate reductase-like glutaredoxin family protein